MNRFYTADPQLLAAIHCGAIRLARGSQQRSSSLVAPGCEVDEQKPTALGVDVNLRRRKPSA